jgi:hypothetical protein
MNRLRRNAPVKETNNEQHNGDSAALTNEHSESLPNQTRSTKKAFVEPTITLPVDVLETTTAFLQGNSQGAADLPIPTPTPPIP